MRLVGLLVIVGFVAACGDESGPAEPSPSGASAADEVPSWAHVAPEQISEAKKHGVPVAFENELGMCFVLIPAGTFLMGSPENEEGRYDVEAQHEVTISKPFFVQTTEVTNGQFQAFEPHHRSGSYERRSLNEPQQPAAGVAWSEAVAFADWLARIDSARTYRLPTEAEWEYACRAGSRTAFSWGESEADAGRYANLADRAARRLKPEWTMALDAEDGNPVASKVGSYLPNAWGLHDMHGNVWEWCQDWFGPYEPGRVLDPTGPPNFGASTPIRVLRGGAWTSLPVYARSASRSCYDPAKSGPNDRGFRLVSPLPEPGT